MAVNTTRVRRGDRGIEGGDVKLGFDEAMVGGADDQAASITIDPSERDNNPFLGSEDREDWDLPEDKRGKQPVGGDKGSDTERAAGEREQGHEVGEGDDQEDVRLAYDEPGEEQRSSRRQRRNQSRRTAIDRRDQQIAFLANELQQLKQQQAGIVGGQFNLSARDVDQRIQYHQNAIDRADQEIADAITKNDGATVVALQRERDKINYGLWQLQGMRERLQEQARQMSEGGPVDQQGQPPERQPTPQEVQAYQAQEGEYERMRDVFLDRYTWFEPETGDDPDHDFIRRLDRTLVQEGYQRHQKAFWHEMERRLQDAGFRPERGKMINERNDQDDRDDRQFESRRNFQSRRVNGNGSGGPVNGGRRYGGPPTGVVRSVSRPGRGEPSFALSDIQRDMLRDEDLLRDDLDEADQARRDRIINKWRRGAEQLQRSRG